MSKALQTFLIRTSTVTLLLAILFTGLSVGTAQAYTTSYTWNDLKSDDLSEADKKRIKTILYGEQYLGTPYEFGADYGQTKTFDCSSFTKTVFAKIGINLPRVSRDQAKPRHLCQQKQSESR